MKKEVILEVVKKLVGEIDPVGSTHVDDIRFKNLETMCELVEDLISDIQGVYQDNIGAHEHSRIKAASLAGRCIRDIVQENDPDHHNHKY